MNRRSFLLGLGSAALIAAPAVIRTPGLLMPVRALVPGEFGLAPLGDAYWHEVVALASDTLIFGMGVRWNGRRVAPNTPQYKRALELIASKRDGGQGDILRLHQPQPTYRGNGIAGLLHDA